MHIRTISHLVGAAMERLRNGRAHTRITGTTFLVLPPIEGDESTWDLYCFEAERIVAEGLRHCDIILHITGTL